MKRISQKCEKKFYYSRGDQTEAQDETHHNKLCSSATVLHK